MSHFRSYSETRLCGPTWVIQISASQLYGDLKNRQKLDHLTATCKTISKEKLFPRCTLLPTWTFIISTFSIALWTLHFIPSTSMFSEVLSRASVQCSSESNSTKAQQTSPVANWFFRGFVSETETMCEALGKRASTFSFEIDAGSGIMQSLFGEKSFFCPPLLSDWNAKIKLYSNFN